MRRFAFASVLLALCLGPRPCSADLRIVTFNLYNRPWERAQRLQSAIETLRKQKPDIVCLQEVATGWILRGDPAELIAKELGMGFVRHWHEQNLGIFSTGLAVLSRFPIHSSEYREFARHPLLDPKGYMLARIEVPGSTRPLQVVNLHMASTNDEGIRDSEWRELTAFVKPLREQGPMVIAGDFNTLPEHPGLREFARATGAKSLYDGWKEISRMRTWTPDYRDSCGQSGDPRAELIDYVFVMGDSSFTNGRIVLPGRPPHPSDHCPVLAEVRLPDAR